MIKASELLVAGSKGTNRTSRSGVLLLPGEFGVGIVVQYRINHRRLLRGGVGDNVGYGVSGLIEKRVNDGSSAHRFLFYSRARALLRKSSS